MGIFDLFKKLTSTQNHNVNTSVQSNNDYIRISDRTNKYTLINNENIVTDGGKAEAFENTLHTRLNCYDKKICPECSTILESLPKSKGKCKHCKNDIYSTSSFIDLNKNLLLTIQEYTSLKSHRDTFYKFKQLSKDLSSLGITKNDFDIARSELASNFSDEDVIWRMLNNTSLQTFSTLEIGLHSNTHRVMASLLEKECKYHDAIYNYLYVCYLNINGCNNNKQSLDKCFNTSLSIIPKGLLTRIIHCMKESNICIDNVKECFLTLEQRNIPTPFTVLQSWNKFKIAYDEYNSSK